MQEDDETHSTEWQSTKREPRAFSDTTAYQPPEAAIENKRSGRQLAITVTLAILFLAAIGVVTWRALSLG